ncbi:cupin domain-containing protein [Actinomadura logoneensis]|uniref:Cupin domain-containing protein n=1 Tax=Actinomadura logoneensis TaxID=2293572 RepID=A0A372JK88_9ACTN|nr:cupin domain-containing protein [Actinomadura logoneensis]RFU40437.1 cupin domain-containing protein [Actinomadura logoneensis]
MRLRHLAVAAAVGGLLLTASEAAAQSSSAPKPSADKAVYVPLRGGQWQPCEGLAGCTFKSLRGNPETGPSEAVFRLKAGTEFAPHWHTSPEHVLGISGRLSWNVKGGPHARIGQGDFLYYPSKAVHWGKCLDGADCVYKVYDDLPYDFHAGR